MFLYIVELVKIGHILTLIYCDCGDEEIIFDDDLNQQKVHTFVCRMATRTRNVKFFFAGCDRRQKLSLHHHRPNLNRKSSNLTYEHLKKPANKFLSFLDRYTKLSRFLPKSDQM